MNNWSCLGHATWLAEVDGLRLLFDPLLQDLHHGGVFEVSPPRIVHAEALRPDFIIVSHRHPDHFDLKSLKRLAELDPDTVVVTSDDLVAASAKRLGFKTTRVVPPATTIDLDGPRLVTTPSVGATDPEWGMIVTHSDRDRDHGAVYNQIDTSLGSPDQVREFLTRVGITNQSSNPLALALARWQPLLEVEAMIGGAIGFPFRAYNDELTRMAALDAAMIVPSAAGTKHTGAHAFMNRLVYPITQERFVADARRRLPATTRVEPAITGATYRVRNHKVDIEKAGACDLVTVSKEAREPRVYRPLDIPPIVDVGGGATHQESELRSRIDGWVKTSLVPVLADKRPNVRYLLEVIYPSGLVEMRSILNGDCQNDIEDPEWDVRCAVAASLFLDVIEGRRHWGELLLGGMLRGCSRAYEVNDRGLRALPLQPLFLYEAISYEHSVRRALDTELFSG